MIALALLLLSKLRRCQGQEEKIGCVCVGACERVTDFGPVGQLDVREGVTLKIILF
jgi:hypothetical protein